MTNIYSGDWPLVTAIVTTYNRPELCKRAVKSVLAQTYEPLETIIVEDGTDSGIKEWLNVESPNIKYIRHEENRGLAAARNTGLEHAKGQFVAYLDDDDAWKPERIERQIVEFTSMSPEQRTKVGVVYCGTEKRTQEGEIIGINHPKNSGNLREAIQETGASTLSSTFLFTRDALLDVGGFDENLPSSIDHDIWMALAVEGYHAIAIDLPLVITYESDHQDMMTNTYPRIEGVKQYVEKWIPTYEEWYGVEAGNRHGEQYFARVIARLVESNVRDGEFKEAWDAIRAIFKFSGQYRHNTTYVGHAVIKAVVLETFPEPAVSALRKIKRKIAR